MKNIIIKAMLVICLLFNSSAVVLGERIVLKNKMDEITVFGLDPSRDFSSDLSERLKKKLKLSNNLKRKYNFVKLTDCGQGYFPTINNLGEIFYQKYDSEGNPNVFSPQFGWLTNSSTGNLRFPDVNDDREIVYADLESGLPGFQIFSTQRGWIASQSNLPSINSLGEIVYWRSYNYPYSIVSTERGTLFSSAEVRDPEINDLGEVVFRDRDSNGIWQVQSSLRGMITNFTEDRGAGTPTIKKDGEIFYIASDEIGIKQIFSNVHGKLTDNQTFPEPTHYGQWTGKEKFGLYSQGVGYYPDVNEKGEIVFSRILVEGPFCEDDSVECHGNICVQLYVAIPVDVYDVIIDIKPGSYPNNISISDRGVVPVAILGGENFDVKNINIYSLRFNGCDVIVKGNKEKTMCHYEDVTGDFSTYPEGDPDGYDDLVCLFENDPAQWEIEQAEANLTGELIDGTPIEGNDSVSIAP